MHTHTQEHLLMSFFLYIYMYMKLYEVIYIFWSGKTSVIFFRGALHWREGERERESSRKGSVDSSANFYTLRIRLLGLPKPSSSPLFEPHLILLHSCLGSMLHPFHSEVMRPFTSSEIIGRQSSRTSRNESFGAKWDPHVGPCSDMLPRRPFLTHFYPLFQPHWASVSPSSSEHDSRLMFDGPTKALEPHSIQIGENRATSLPEDA